MITEDVLEDLLHAAGDEVEVPADGAARVLGAVAAARPAFRTAEGAAGGGVGGAGGGLRGRLRQFPPGYRLLAGAAAAGLAVVGVIALGAHPRHPSSAAAVRSTTLAVPPAVGAPSGPDLGVGGGGSASSAGTGSGTTGAGIATGTGGAGASALAAPSATAPAAPLPQSASGSSADTAAPAVGGPRVVMTATFDLEVAKGKVPGTLVSVQAEAAKFGGYVASSNSSLAGPDPQGTITLRVPSAQYKQVRRDLEGGAFGRTVSVVETGTDVTAQFTDLAARLTALEDSRQTYLTLLSKATTIGDTLAVQQQLDGIQQQIEQLQGQQNLLRDQSDFATVTVSVTEAGSFPGVPKPPATGLARAFEHARSNFAGGIERLVGDSGSALVVVLVLGVLLLAGRWALRLIQRRMI